MLSVQGIAVPRSKGICSLPVIRPIPRSFHILKHPSLPVEVIGNIFVLVYQSSHDPISQSTSLSHVCRRWRQISLSVPSLWTFVYLSLPLSRSQLARTCTWIIRSRNQPLDIHMDFRDPSWDWDEGSHIFDSKAMDSIMRLLVPQASRWRSFELLTDTWAPIFTFLSSTVAIEPAHCLQTIRLARCNEYFVALGELFRPANLALPVAWFRGGTSLSRLRHVSLSGVHVDWAQSGLTGLQELELRYHAQDVMPTLSEFRSILRANPGLERFAILGWGPQMNHPLESEREYDDPYVIDLPQLEELEFGFVDVEHAIGLVSSFDLPKLRVLSIEDVAFGIQPCERQDCSRLLDRLVEMSATDLGAPRIPLSRLREVSLRSIYADEGSIRGLFGRLCAVTSLTLDRLDAVPLLATCSVLEACVHLEVLTLKDIDAASAAHVISSCTFPTPLRIFLDIDGDDGDGNVDQEG